MTQTEQHLKSPAKLEEVLRSIALAQNQAAQTPNPDHLFLKIAREYLNAEAIALILVDPERSGVFTKKEFGAGVDWKITSNLPSEHSFIVQALKGAGIACWQGDYAASSSSEALDGVKGVALHNIVSAPLHSHSVIFGAVNFINCTPFPPEESALTGVMLILTALADALYHNEVVRELGASEAEAKFSKAQLLQSRNMLRSIFDSIPQSYYIIDKEYVITAINQARAQRAGQDPRTLYGRVCYQALYGLSAPCADCNAAATFETGRSLHRTAVFEAENGESTDWTVATYPVFDACKEVDHVILMEQDITDIRRLEMEVMQTEKLAAIGQLAAGVAHEINNPLTSILVNSQLLLEDLPAEQQENIESVKLIEMAAVRASNVARNLLGLVRKEDYEFEEMDLNESLQSALMMVSHEFLTHQIKVTFDRAEQLPLYKGSFTHLQGVWINLLMNAVEAIGEKKGEVKVTSHFEEDVFYVEVRDNGAGISDQNLDKIFEPYFTTKHKGHDVGLGLSLVKRTIQAHGGQIMVESSPGEGARFTVILPAKH